MKRLVGLLSSAGLCVYALVVAHNATAQLTFVGDEFQVNDATTSVQNFPVVAAQSTGDFIVSWRDVSSGGSEVSARRFGFDGVPPASQFAVNTNTVGVQEFPSIAVLDDDSFIVVWESVCCIPNSGRDLYGQLFNENGSPAGTEFVVNSTTDGAQTTAAVAALADGGFVVVWNHYTELVGLTQIRGRRFDDAADPVGTEFEVTPGDDGGQYAADVEGLNGGGFITVYADYYPDGSSSAVIAKRYGADGSQVGTEFQVNTYTTSYQTGPSVGVHGDDSFVVTWVSGYQDGQYNGIFGQRFSAAADPLGTEFQINSYTTQYQGGSDVAVDDDGGFAVVWFTNSDVGGATRGDVAMRAFDNAGTPVGAEFQVNQFTPNYQSYPRLAHMGAGRYAVTWHDLGGQDGDRGGIFARLVGPPALCGDANGDGSRSASDALVTLRTAVGTSNCPLTACDVNTSGAITASDALFILRFAVGQPVELNCPVA